MGCRPEYVEIVLCSLMTWLPELLEEIEVYEIIALVLMVS